MRRELGSYLRREVNGEGKQVIAELRFTSKSNVLIQLADMIVGSLARGYRTDKPDRHVYRELLSARIEDVWEFGQERRG